MHYTVACPSGIQSAKLPPTPSQYTRPSTRPRLKIACFRTRVFVQFGSSQPKTTERSSLLYVMCLPDAVTRFQTDTPNPTRQPATRPSSLRFRPQAIAWLLTLPVWIGCRTPDLQPFQESTARIHESVVMAQDRFTEDLKLLNQSASATPGGTKRLRDALAGFTDQWEARTAACQALVDYADTLADIAAAPAKARRNSEALASSLKSMSKAFGFYGTALQGATDLTVELESLANQIRATRALRKLVLQVDPALQQVGLVLNRDFESTIETLRRLDADLEILLRGDYGMRLDLRQILEQNLKTNLVTLRHQAKGTNWARAVKEFTTESVVISKYLEEDDRWTGSYFRSVKDSRTRLRADIELLSAARKGVTSWTKAHLKLVKALETGVQPDWSQLKRSAENIDKAIKQLTRDAH